MPDLDRLFQALQLDADLIPSADVSVIRASGRRRRLRRATAGAVAVGIVLGSVLVGPAIWPKTTRPPANPAPTAVTFAPLRDVGGEEDTFGTQTSSRPKTVATAVMNGRGYVVWLDENGVPSVAAVDVASGRRIWGPATLESAPTSWAAVLPLPQVVVVVSGFDDGDHAAVTGLDPTTGERLWQRNFGAVDGLLYETAVVLADRSTGVMQAIDMRSGRTLWTVADPSGSLLTVLGMQSSVGVSGVSNYLPPVYTDHRLVVVGGDSMLRVYDALTGQLQGSRTAAGNEALAYDGTVFAVRDSTSTVPNQVLAYQAIGTDAARVVYQSPHGTSRLRALSPCGARRICLVEGYGTNNGADAEVVAVDLDHRVSVWRTLSGDLDALTPMGEYVLGRSDGGLVGLYGADGGTVLVPQGTAFRADRVDPGAVLLLRPQTEDALQAADATEVVGVVVATGEQISLGRIRIRPSSCSWDARFLLCATGTGFQVWRFAAD
jgi:molecular chaperone HscA